MFTNMSDTGVVGYISLDRESVKWPGRGVLGSFDRRLIILAVVKGLHFSPMQKFPFEALPQMSMQSCREKEYRAIMITTLIRSPPFNGSVMELSW